MGLLVFSLSLACDKQAEPEAGANEQPSPNDEHAPQAEPEPPAPPAPPPEPVDGAEFDGGIYVQTCDDPRCPDLLQVAGNDHCKGLELGGRSWRLPSKDEAARFGSLSLEQTGGYHWTGTAYAEDDAQVWIVDPKSDQPTTIPKDRKPFRVRCVSDHETTGGPAAAE